MSDTEKQQLALVRGGKPAPHMDFSIPALEPEILGPELDELVLVAERTRVRVVEIVVERFYLPRRRCA